MDEPPKEPDLELLKAARQLGERITSSSSADRLRQHADTLNRSVAVNALQSMPTREEIATGQVRAEIERLAQIVSALLDLGVTQAAASEKATRTARRLNIALLLLTAAILALTYVLVAEVVGWWPFPRPLV